MMRWHKVKSLPRRQPRRELEAVVHLLAYRELAACIDGLVYHTPNGGHRSKKTAKALKAMGTMRGVPDITIIYPGGLAFIEVKASGKKQFDHQKVFEAYCQQYGHRYAVIDNHEQVKPLIKEWGLPLVKDGELTPTQRMMRDNPLD